MSRARTAKVRKLSAALPPRASSPGGGPELIAGITVTIKGRELAVRIADRIRWHRERGDVLIQQMRKLTELERTTAEDLAYMLGRYESPRGVLEKRLREHEERASFLAFVRDHIMLDAIYRLDSADLKMIDVLPN
jgi:hypothetical protein